MNLRSTKVACNGCTACCREIAFVDADFGDDVASYQTEDLWLAGDRRTALQRLSDGSCVYLGKAGCTIYDRRPAVCRGFSCVQFVLDHDDKFLDEGARRGALSDEVISAGRARLPIGSMRKR